MLLSPRQIGEHGVHHILRIWMPHTILDDPLESILQRINLNQDECYATLSKPQISMHATVPWIVSYAI